MVELSQPAVIQAFHTFLMFLALVDKVILTYYTKKGLFHQPVHQ